MHPHSVKWCRAPASKVLQNWSRLEGTHQWVLSVILETPSMVFCVGFFRLMMWKALAPDGGAYSTPPYPLADCVGIPCGNPPPPSQILHMPLGIMHDCTNFFLVQAQPYLLLNALVYFWVVLMVCISCGVVFAIHPPSCSPPCHHHTASCNYLG